MAYVSENIDNYLRNISYPADKSDLVNNAIAKNAPEEIVRSFDTLPNKLFESAEDVRENMHKGHNAGEWNQIGKMAAEHPSPNNEACERPQR